MKGDEKELISLCIKGNYTAQKVLYDKYSKLFYTICLRYCKDEDEAQDILQDAFIKIFKNLSQFKHEGSFEGWMKRIVVNTSIEYYRKKIHFFSIEDNENSEEMPMQIDNNNIDESILLGLIQALPNGFRMIFNMYVIEGYNHIEIAEKLGISEGTSKSQLSRARALLQRKIEELYKMNL